MSSSFSGKLNCHERIRQIRKQLGLTQEAFAEQLDISYSAYKSWKVVKIFLPLTRYINSSRSFRFLQTTCSLTNGTL